MTKEKPLKGIREEVEGTKVTKAVVKSIRDQILEKNDITTEEVLVPEWVDAPLYVKTMSGLERDTWERSMFQENEEGNIDKNLKNYRAKLLARTLCEDKEGLIRVFTDEDALALGKKNSAVIDRCVTVATKLNGIEAKDKKALVKN